MLERACSELKTLGYELKVGIELEFQLLTQDKNGKLIPIED